MANRAFFQTVSNLVERLSLLQGQFTAGSTGAVSGVQGSGIADVVRVGTGAYQVKLQDSYDRLLAFHITQEEAPGTPVLLTTGLSNTTAYEITTVGTPVNGTATYTISSGAGILQATIAGVVIQITWASSDNNSATLLAAAINANATLATLVTAVASTNTVVVTARNLGVVSTVAAGSGMTVATATTTGEASVALQWQRVGLAVGVTPAVGVAFVSNSAGAQAAASATAAAAPVAGTATTLGQVANLFGHPSTTVRTSVPSHGVGGYFMFQVRSGIGVAVDPPSGSVLKFDMLLRNSSVKGKGE